MTESEVFTPREQRRTVEIAHTEPVSGILRLDDIAAQREDSQQLDETVRAVVARHLELSPQALTNDLRLDEHGADEGWAAKMMTEVGDALDVRFPDDFLDGVDTYEQLTSAVRIAVGS